MTQRITPLTCAALLAATLSLAACEDSEARAERHFNSGVALIEAGDVTEALLEFRNVLRLQPANLEARMHIARAQRERGQLGEAFREYLQVAERDPDILEAQLALAQIALQADDWDTADRHGRIAGRLAPEDPQVALVSAVLDYRDAVIAGDRGATGAPAEVVRALIDESGDSAVAWRLLIDHALAEGTQMERGLAQIDEALADRPDVYDFHELRLRVLLELGRLDEVRATIERMMEQFPDDARPQQLYIRWLVQRDETDAAEAHLRARADEPGADVQRMMQLVSFVHQLRGAEAAVAEVDRLIAAGGDARRLGSARAALRHESGARDAAIAELRGLLQGADGSEENNDLRVQLARMLIGAGATGDARALVTEVLEADAGHVEALKMRAAWLIDDDRPTEAITALRQAQGNAPRDPIIMMLMGQAHEREGARDLAGERYAQAVEMSGDAPRPTLVYAQYLLREGRLDAAESVLTSALRRAPEDLGLLRGMGEVLLRRGAWDRTQRLIWQLRAIDRPEAVGLADALEADLLLRQGRTEDTVAFLEGLVRDGSGQGGALAALVQTQVRAGQIDGAVALIDGELAERPDDPTLRFLRAGLHVLTGELETAEAMYRRLVTEYPSAEPPLRTLYGLLQAQGRGAEADALIDAVLADAPDAMIPRLIRAARLEQTFDFEGAIAIYEEIYAANSGNLVIANNLASLISTHRPDEASLERAFAIARRLRGSEVPAFQDTYGWIQYRRGFYDEALSYLEPAAAGLPNDPLVQFHLGMTYYALQRHGEARETLTRALQIAGDAPLPQFVRAREVLEELGGL